MGTRENWFESRILLITALAASILPTTQVKAADWERFQLWNECMPMRSLVSGWRTFEWSELGNIESDNAIAEGFVKSKLEELSLYDESEITSSSSVLTINITMNNVRENEPNGQLYYDVDISYHKPMTDFRTGLTMIASAWESGSFGSFDEGNPFSNSTGVLGVVDEHIEEFAKEYFRINADACF